MKSLAEYIRSVRFSLSYSFKFVPADTWVLVFLYMLSGALPFATAYLLGSLVNIIVLATTSYSYGNIWYVLIGYAIVTGLPGIIGILQLYVNRRRMIRLQVETELDIIKQRERIDIAKFEDSEFLDLSQRAFRNGPNPIYQLSNAQFDILNSLTGLVIGTILAIQFNFLIYLIVILSAIPAFITDIKFAGQSWSIWAKDSPERRRFGDLRQHFTLKNMLIETKLLQASEKLITWMRGILSDFSQKQLALEKKRVWTSSLADMVALLGFTAGLVLIVKGVVSGVTQVGTLVYMMSTLSSVRNSIAQLLERVSGQYENHLIVQDIIKFIDTKPVIIESQNPTKLSLQTAPEIVFENVSFKYQDSEKFSLQNVSLTFKAGDNIGLVGNNGAGKTTLVKLLCKIYNPTEGRILVNGVDLKDIETKEWWSYLAVMLQEYATYDFIVKDAIAIGKPNASTNMTKVIEAGKTSRSHDFIMEWDDKYDEQIGVEFKGKEPSKGQRQKLSIAKNLYREGLVMVLDEPTASVDADSESKIFDSIENLPTDRTAILISHDFSTISFCNKIFVLSEGELIEEGTHEELIKKKGTYAKLYDLQAKRFKR